MVSKVEKEQDLKRVEDRIRASIIDLVSRPRPNINALVFLVQELGEISDYIDVVERNLP